MGLDWNPGNKAKPGHEAEDAPLERYHEISITAFETLGAPIVGRDAAADAWARQLRVDRGIEMLEDEFLNDFETTRTAARVATSRPTRSDPSSCGTARMTWVRTCPTRPTTRRAARA
jgi:hypothetical protein